MSSKKDNRFLLEGQRDVLALMASNAPLAQVLERLVHVVEDQADGMLCSVLLVDAQGRLRHGAAPSLPTEYNEAIDGLVAGPTAGSCGTAAYRRAPVIVIDTFIDPLWADYRELAGTYSLRACWSTPILSSDESVLGTFAMYYREPRAPTPEHVRLIDMAVQMARVAIERKASDEQLRASEERFRLIAENARDLIAFVDVGGQRIYNSPSYRQLLGDPAKLAGTRAFDDVHPEDRERIRMLHEETVRTGVGGRAEFRLIARDGQVRYLQSEGSAVRDPSGRITGIIVVARDITEQRNAREQLRESEERLRAFMEHSPSVMFMKDPQGRYQDINAQFLRRFDLSRDEVLGRTDFELFPTEQASVFVANDVQVVTEGTPIEIEETARYADGAHISIVSKFPIRSASGEIVAIGGVATDITDRKRSEEALREYQIQLAEGQAIANLGSWRWDLQSGALRWSEQLLKIYGITEAEFTPNLDGYLSRVHPEDRGKTRNVIERALAGGNSFEFEERILRPDGSVRLLASRGRVERDAEGRPIRLYGVSHEVTERRAVEDRMRASEERFRLLVENIRDYAIILLDPNGRIASWNAGAERIKGYRIEEILGRDFSCFYTSEELTRQDPHEQLRIAQRDGRFEGEGWRVRKDGTRFWAHVIITTLLDGQGVVKGYSKITQDITQRKRAEENLHSYAEQLKSTSRRIVEVQENERRRLARELHDEVGQKLSALGINLGIIRDQLPADAGQQVVARMADSIDMVESIGGAIRSVMSELRPTVLEDYGLVAAIRSVAERAIRLSGISIEVNGAELRSKLPIGVEMAMFRVIQEALNNAVKHAQAKRVQIAVTNKNHRVRIVVEDDGIGFTPSAVAPGTDTGGWGLMIMHERAEAVGASFSLESQRGSGTRITVEYLT
jgi:PAS domain S-box-containing protein